MLKNFTQLLSFQKSRCTRPLNPESVPGGLERWGPVVASSSAPQNGFFFSEKDMRDTGDMKKTR